MIEIIIELSIIQWYFVKVEIFQFFVLLGLFFGSVFYISGMGLGFYIVEMGFYGLSRIDSVQLNMNFWRVYIFKKFLKLFVRVMLEYIVNFVIVQKVFVCEVFRVEF